MRLPSGEVIRTVVDRLWVALILVAAASMVYWLIRYDGDGFREVDVYVFHQYALNIDTGMVPYRDFTIGFPLVSLFSDSPTSWNSFSATAIPIAGSRS